jgi:hypothetical protein
MTLRRAGHESATKWRCYIVTSLVPTYSARTEGFASLMLLSVARNVGIDRLAIGLSGLCLVHCVATAVLVLVLASAGGFLLDPRIHEIGLACAIVLGALGLGRGIFDHGYMMPSSIGGIGLGTMAGSLTMPHGIEEVVVSVFGVLVLALGHDLNRRAIA